MLRCGIAARRKPACRVLMCDRFQIRSNGIVESPLRSRLGVAQERLHLAPHLLHGVEIGTEGGRDSKRAGTDSTSCLVSPLSWADRFSRITMSAGRRAGTSTSRMYSRKISRTVALSTTMQAWVSSSLWRQRPNGAFSYCCFQEERRREPWSRPGRIQCGRFLSGDEASPACLPRPRPRPRTNGAVVWPRA